MVEKNGHTDLKDKYCDLDCFLKDKNVIEFSNIKQKLSEMKSLENLVIITGKKEI